VDVIGSDSLLNEHELVTIMDQVFSELGLRVAIRMNNRKVLLGLVEALGIPDRMTDVTVAIDKLEKVGLEKVLLELQEKGIATRVLDGLKPVLQVAGSNKEKLTYLEGVVTRSATGMQGIHEVRSLLDTLASDEVAAEVRFDLTLARGLNYYTGTIFEVQTTEMEMGSICGGGRYDDLTGIFGLEGVSGVGVSFGADRIYDVMLQLDRFPGEGELDTRLLFVNFGPKEAAHILPILRKLRQGGVASELYPDAAKMKKQMGYADARGIPYVALVGEEEMKKGVVTLKEMATGTQEQVTPDELLQRIRS
jgi:histidyl-tRNA synthetase